MLDWRPTPGFEDHPPVSVRDRGLWFVLLAVVALQVLMLVRTDGYQLADSVEYMDRANMWVLGEEFDPTTPRPFSLSALLVPFFWATHALELESYDLALALTRLTQILVGLGTVCVVARIGSRIGGRGLGLAAGVLLGMSVPFARYTIEGLADTEAMLFVALALDSVLRDRTARRGLLTGLYMGAACAFTYKALPVVGAILGAIFLRERLRHGPWLRGVLLTFLVCVGITAFIDRQIYGNFGSSIAGYVLINAMSIVARVLYRLGLVEAATWVGNTFLLAEGRPEVASSEAVIYQVDPEEFYFAQASTDLLPWPLLFLVLLGFLAALRRMRFPETLIAVVVIVSVLLFGQKGHKSYRLLMPVLPLIGLLGAFGLRALRGEATASFGRRALAYLFLGVGLLSVPGSLLKQDVGRHGGYWDALDIVNAESAEERAERESLGLEPEAVRVASAYHWAATLRQKTYIDLIRLPLDPLDYSVPSEELRAASRRVLESLDWFVAHMQVFAAHPELVDVLNRNFEIHSVLYDGESYGPLLPIFLMRRRAQIDEDNADGRSFFRLREGVDGDELSAIRARIQHPSGLRFEHTAANGTLQALELLGWDVETGLGVGSESHRDSELTWVTYHWLARTDGIDDFEFRDRLTDFDGRATLVGLNGHRPAYGAHPTSSWTAGSVLSESYLRVLPRDPTVYGGAHRRGELVPTTLWMKVEGPQVSEAGESGELRRMQVLAPDGEPLSARRPAEEELSEAYRWSGDGAYWDRGGRISLGGFWLPIPPDLRVPDDGQPMGW